MKALSIILATAALAACAIQPPAPLGPQPMSQLGPALSASQARAELVGNTGTGTRTSTHTLWNMYVAPDGSLAATAPQKVEDGTWRLTDDGHFCMTWKTDWDGKEVCQTVHKSGENIQLSSRTSLEVMTFVPGRVL